MLQRQHGSLCRTSFGASSGLSKRPCGVLAFFSGCLSFGVPLAARGHPVKSDSGAQLPGQLFAPAAPLIWPAADGGRASLLPGPAAGLLLCSSSSGSLLAETHRREGNISQLQMDQQESSDTRTCAPRTFTQPLRRYCQPSCVYDVWYVISLRPRAVTTCSFTFSRQEAAKPLSGDRLLSPC